MTTIIFVYNTQYIVYYDTKEAVGCRMLNESLRKVRDKNDERRINVGVSLNIPSGNHVYRKAIHAATCILLAIVILGTSIEAFGLSKAFVDVSSVTGLGVGIYWNQACTNRTFSLDWGLIQAGSKKL
jgi:hypothetical protein